MPCDAPLYIRAASPPTDFDRRRPEIRSALARPRVLWHKGGVSRVRAFAAFLFGAMALGYACIWTYYTQQNAGAFLGITSSYDGWARRLNVATVLPDSPAERAGLRPGDVIEAIEGRPLDTQSPFYDHVTRGRPVDPVRFAVRRDGYPRLIEITAALGSAPSRSPAHTAVQRVAILPLNWYPVPAVLLALTVLFLRVQDRNAWLLALVFAGLGVGPPQTVESVCHPALRGFVLAYGTLFSGMVPAMFYGLLARFPVPSPVDRRLPWLRPILFVAAAAFWVPFAASIAWTGSPWPALRILTPAGTAVLDRVVPGYSFLAFGLGFVSLLLNCRHTAESGARRKARLVAWSFAIGLVPWLAITAVAVWLGKGLFDLPFWLWVPGALMMMVVPLVFGYAVVKHRVLEFSVLVRRSARYLLVQRGFALIAFALSIAVTALFVLVIARVLPRLTDAALPAGIAVGTVFGLVLLRTGGAVASRVTRRIDRAFFRSAYDARQILEELAQQAAVVSDRDELAALMDRQLQEALHPRLLAIYLRDRTGVLRACSGRAGVLPALFEEHASVVGRLEREGKPLDVSAEPVAGLTGAFDVECLVPMLSRRRRLLGLIALGPRLSEESYSREDTALLASIAGHAGGALENLMLAEEMAERIEADRRADQELQIAAEVQRRLLPAKPVAMTTIEVTGRCVQARAVGGDYYDFLDFGQGRIGLVLGDVSGKGLYAALLMAHLQATLRSLSARLAAEDLAALLEGVNHGFWESTAGNHFATLFFGHYEDAGRQLRYANCGHSPPILLRADGTVERLAVTAGAIGLFDAWACSVQDVTLGRDDLLTIFSDGVTEATNDRGEEFGEDRLLEILTAWRTRPLPEVLDRLVDEVRRFGAEQHDDLTLVLVRGL
jgi:sigma-B regulation protein RsbU (phosphoserine phosphatase)